MQYDLNWEKSTVEFKFETQTELRNFMRYVQNGWPHIFSKTNQNTDSLPKEVIEYLKLDLFFSKTNQNTDFLPKEVIEYLKLDLLYDWISNGPRVRKIIANDGAVVVIFTDNRKVIVKRMPGDDDDIYAAVAQAVCKRMYGGTSSFHKMVDKKLEDFRSPVSIAEPVLNTFGKFFDSLWHATHSNDLPNDLRNKSEEDKE